MSTVKDLAQLGKLIARHHGWPAARSFKSYTMEDADRAILSQCAVDLLKVFPPMTDPSALMSAALAVQAEKRLQAPVQVVAGTLAVEGVPVLGDRAPFDGQAVFASAVPEWPGHVWVMVGPWVVDVALFRIAYSRHAPARLAKHVDLAFGPNKGLYVDSWKHTPRMGLTYEPAYVLSAAEVTRLMGGAYHAIKQTLG